ncbi:hypothetical protein JW926_00985 [Candidatus Sumerlaeota bacterium]|nr:hypothetical protein [Candidatus Sumerlaeota bacterium]
MNGESHQFETFLVAGVNDNQLCLKGWHDRSIDQRTGISFRPTSKESIFQLRMEAGDLELVALVSAGVALCGGALRGELLFNEKPVGNFTLDSENWTLLRFPLSIAEEGWMSFSWRIHNPYIPHEILKNGDFREMGVNIAAIRIERKKQ